MEMTIIGLFRPYFDATALSSYLVTDLFIPLK
jgi:hypothetical protein